MGNLLAIPARRPVATAMLFLAAALLGLFAWHRIPVELLPSLSGDRLFVRYTRPGAEPEVLEREILMPLESRVGALSGVVETWGEISGSSGTLQVALDARSDYRVREMELREIAAEIARDQPEGTVVTVSTQDAARVSGFAMIVQVLGAEASGSLRDFIEEQVQSRLESVPGVSRVVVAGGASTELVIGLDRERLAAHGIRPLQVSDALRRWVDDSQYLGSVEHAGRRMSVVLDGRIEGLASLGEIRIADGSAVRLRHVADIELAAAEISSVFRVNGRPAVGLLVFQNEGANLIELGRDLRTRIDALRKDFNPYGLDFVIGFDGAETVDEQLGRFRQLAASGFVTTLLVLFAFLREVRAVAVVAIAVPVSLLITGAMLHLSGFSINLITLVGLVIGVGLLVDNSIVVYEAVQRRLETGSDARRASVDGIRRTLRAIVGASATNCVVFLPPLYLIEDAVTRELLKNIVAGILFPLLASLMVATGLVPLLAERLAAPAALARMRGSASRRSDYGGMRRPKPVRELSVGLLKEALRRPIPWLTAVFFSVLVTAAVALPWVLINTVSQSGSAASRVAVDVTLQRGSTLDRASLVFSQMEQELLRLEGVDRVETSYREDQGSITVHLGTVTNGAAGTNAAAVRQALRDVVAEMNDVRIEPAGGALEAGEGEARLLGGGRSAIAVSGPDMTQIARIANELMERLRSLPQIEDVYIEQRNGFSELRIETDTHALTSHGVFPEQVMGALRYSGREGQPLPVRFTTSNDREVPVRVRRTSPEDISASQWVEQTPILAGLSVLPMSELATASVSAPPPAITHRNGRREVTVEYSLKEGVPEAGPARIALDREIDRVVNAYVPPGYSVRTVSAAQTEWIKVALIPILFALYAVLAITFESLTAPFLILLAIPLTLLGAVWALFFAGMGFDTFAAVGAVALLGLTVNPAILLLDRMQQRRLNAGSSGGAAAVMAVRERTRPVLMSTATTLAALWPLALSTGQEFEVWPPFATVVMGGLATSTLLTLFIVPAGFVALSRIDRLLGSVRERLAAPLFRRSRGSRSAAAPTMSPMVIETRYLSKVYGRPGAPIRAWQKHASFFRQFKHRSKQDVKDRALTFSVVLLGCAYLAVAAQSMFWTVAYSFVAAGVLTRLLAELRCLRVEASAAPEQVRDPARLGHLIPIFTPWAALAVLLVIYTLLPRMNGNSSELPLAAVVLLAVAILVIQCGRRTAVQINSGALPKRTAAGWFGPAGNAWARFSSRFFGADLSGQSFTALASFDFRAERGMIGVLGPNGAGKTTLLRLLASIYEPSVGTVHYGGIEKRKIGRHLAGYIGYLPQEFGLPTHMSAREYLMYFALLYAVGDERQCAKRVDLLLEEVGLADRQHDKIGSFSGGMRQRVGIARTLLREPPCLIVDEPTAGLDPRERIRLRSLLTRLAREKVVLFSTHVVEDVAVACERVIVVNKGRLVFDGPPQELEAQAENKVWELRLAEIEARELSKRCKVVNQVQEGGGVSRMRVLSGSRPHPDALQTKPNLDDGYLQLLYGGRFA